MECTGKPMAWFSSLHKAYLMYGPAGLAGLLLPYTLLQLSQPGGLQERLKAFAAVHAVLAAVMTHAGARVAFGPAAWSAAALAALLPTAQVHVGLASGSLLLKSGFGGQD